MYYYIMREKGEGRPKESAVFLTGVGCSSRIDFLIRGHEKNERTKEA